MKDKAGNCNIRIGRSHPWSMVSLFVLGSQQLSSIGNASSIITWLFDFKAQLFCFIVTCTQTYILITLSFSIVALYSSVLKVYPSSIL